MPNTINRPWTYPDYKKKPYFTEIVSFYNEIATDVNNALSPNDTNLVYSTYAALQAATGLSSTLIGKFALVQADNSYWRLDQVTPVTKWTMTSGKDETRGDITWIIDGTLGNDTTGNGSVLYPFKSFACLDLLPKTIKHTVKIKPAAGTYTYFPEFVEFNYAGGELIIDASGETYPVVEGPFTISSFTGSTSSYLGYPISTEITVVGDPGWNTDDLYGHFLHFTSGNYNDRILPVIRNTSADMVETCYDPYTFANGDTFNVVSCPVVINVSHQVIFHNTETRGDAYSNDWGASSESPQSQFFYMCGINLQAANGASGDLSRAIIFSNIRGYLSFVRLGNISTSPVVGSIDTDMFFSSVPSGTFDVDVLGDWYLSAIQVVANNGVVPIAYYRDIYITNSAWYYVTTRNAVNITGGPWSAFSYSHIGALVTAGVVKTSIQATLIDAANTNDEAIYAIACTIYLDGVYVKNTTRALRLKNAAHCVTSWFQGESLSENYAVQIYRCSTLVSTGANVDVAGIVGAIEFPFSGTNNATWPSSGSSYTDNAGSYVLTE